MVSTDRFYTSVDNCMMLKNLLDMMMYGTVIEDRGPQHSGIVESILEKVGDYIYQYSNLPVSLTFQVEGFSCNWDLVIVDMPRQKL